jgi:hypothetical protein
MAKSSKPPSKNSVPARFSRTTEPRGATVRAAPRTRPDAEQLRAIRATLDAIVDEQGQTETAESIGIGPAALRRFLDNPSRTRDGLINKIEQFVETADRKNAFHSQRTYIAIAASIGAEVRNHTFIDRFAGEYMVLRAHVPTRQALVSRLEITGDPDRQVVRFRHRHVILDAEPLLSDEVQVVTPFEYTGFVFNTGDCAFFLSAARGAAHVKEIIVQLPTNTNAGEAPFMGIILTLSSDRRLPFASRLLLKKIPDPKATLDEVYEPGFKSWDRFSREVRREFSDEGNNGLLFARASTEAIVLP